jgi:hypothetical protein
MSDFVNQWIRCNLCFHGFEGNGGMLTSCGHFFCNRAECKLPCASGEKTTCPICKNECGAISLGDSLPSEVLQFFEDPEVLCQRAMDVLRFHNHQKELSREHFMETQRRLDSLQQMVNDLQAENRGLHDALAKYSKSETKPPRQSECLIPGIIGGKALQPKRPAKREELFSLGDVKPPEPAAAKPPPPKEAEPITKLFTPTLASRLQSLTGKKMYNPVQIHD